jgi:hypothetical protein
MTRVVDRFLDLLSSGYKGQVLGFLDSRFQVSLDLPLKPNIALKVSNSLNI